MYKYLNRYIIGFEDKYYAAYSGIGDISEAMQIVNGEHLAKTEEEKSEEKPWGEDEGIYISYNWEGHSIIRKTKCFRILERNAKISKTKRNFSRLYPTPQKIKKNRPASPERNTFEGS